MDCFLRGRKKYEIANYNYADSFFDGSWKYLASKLVKHKDGCYYFHLTCEKEREELDITKAANFMGIDVGINHFISRNNRKGREFRCEVCEYELNADLVGARNIEERTRVLRHDLEAQGLVVNSPNENSLVESLKLPAIAGAVDKGC